MQAKSITGWHSHRRLARNVSYSLVEGCSAPECPCCLSVFHSFERLHNHLKHTQCGTLIGETAEALDTAQHEEQRCTRLQQGRDARKAAYAAVKTIKPCKKQPGYKRGLSSRAPASLYRVEPPKAPFMPDLATSAVLYTVPMVKYRFFLHLFSGQRRLDDLHAVFEEMMSPFAATIVLSIDIVNGDMGDLANPEHLAFWQHLILSKLVVLVFGGPPCNTWSTARFNSEVINHYPDLEHKPRPVRSAALPWGLECLTPSERKNVDCDNLLLRAQGTLMWACHFAGVPAVREHPADPWWLSPEFAPSS